MIYSGHMAMLTLLVMAGADAYGPGALRLNPDSYPGSAPPLTQPHAGESKVVHWLVSAVLGGIAFWCMARCQDHYTVDLVCLPWFYESNIVF